MKKVAFHNLGCKVNSCETEAMAGDFIRHGYELADFNSKADIYVINTCTVTSMADKKSRQMLHRAKRLNPEATVVAVGCFVQANPDDALNDPDIDIVIGNNDKYRAYELITAHQSQICDINHTDVYEYLPESENRLHTRAFIKIQDGCNQFCSYCLIPYVRGRVRSRSPESILDEIKRLYSEGCLEFVLTGIHLSSYGTDGKTEKMGPPLLKLIREISGIIPNGRIRLGSLEPRVITYDFAKGLSEIKNLCPHFHLSLQSGCDETLKRMNRHYTTFQYEEAVNILREVYEHPAITTDVIVGFPGETDEEFENTVRFLERINLYEMHIFKYSLRKGTAAERLPGRVSPDIKEKRSNILLEMNKLHKKEFCRYYENKECEVLFEDTESLINSDKNKNVSYLVGYNPEYVKIGISEGIYASGQMARVKGKIIDF